MRSCGLQIQPLPFDYYICEEATPIFAAKMAEASGWYYAPTLPAGAAPLGPFDEEGLKGAVHRSVDPIQQDLPLPPTHHLPMRARAHMPCRPGCQWPHRRLQLCVEAGL